MAAKSHEEMQNELGQCLGTTLDRLQTIWDEIGIHHDQRRERTKVVFLHLHTLLEEMVKEEESLKNNLLANVEKYGAELIKLSKEMSVPVHEPKEGMSILQLEKELRTKVDSLAQEKHERLKLLRKLKESDQKLCDILCSTPYYIPSGSVPSQEQLEELKKHITKLNEEKETRHTKFLSTKKDIISLLENLEQCPNTSFERDIVCEEEDTFLLSHENMLALDQLHQELELKVKEQKDLAENLRERIVTLWDRLLIPAEERSAFNKVHDGFKPSVIKGLKEEVARCELLKLQNIQRFVEGMRKELVEWWAKCFIGKEEKEKFTAFKSDDFSEELLELHDQEVNRVKQYYEHNKVMLDRVARWESLWKDFQEFERRARDPNRFNNRGGGLLQEEKARKKIQKELPKVEQEVKDAIAAWETENCKEFLVGGVRFTEYIDQQWEQYKQEKENEKFQRHRRNAKVMEEEMVYGSKPVTPAKRRFIGTPSKTPNKSRRLNDTTKTPGSMSRMASHSTVFASPNKLPPRSASKTAKIFSPRVSPRLTPKTPRTPCQTIRF